MTNRYQQRDLRVVLLASTAAVVLAVGLVLSLAIGFSLLQLASYPWAPSYRELQDETVVRGISRIHSETGVYPSSLDEAGLDPPSTFYGPWRYRVLNSGQACELSVGDYGRYGFQLSWTPEGGWYLDT